MVSLGHAIASVPGTIAAVEERNEVALATRLKAIVLAYPQIDRVFVATPEGTVWSDYPPAPGAYGKEQADAEWQRGVSAEWNPSISGVYVRPYGEPLPVVAIASPIRSESGAILGSLVFEYRTELIWRWLQNIRLGPSGHLLVVDHAGNLLAHPRVSPREATLSRAYSAVSEIHAAAQGVVLSARYEDPLTREEMVATFQPLQIGDHTWVVIAQQPVAEAYALLARVRFNIVLASIVLTIFTLAMVVALARSTAHNEHLNRALAAKNQTLQDITSFVSHQLRAPVTAMRWTIESILDGDYGEVREEMKEPLSQLHGVAIENGNLINDILNVSRIDRGVIEVDVQPVALSEIAERALRDYRPALERAGLTLTLEGMNRSIVVQADKEKMAEAVTNAISNAIKHTKKGGVTLSLRSDERFGFIDVSDTGEGMTPEIMDRLFSRTGIAGSNTDSAQSTGLGLYIARNFMQLMHGDITVASTPGKGSTFTYSAPLAPKGTQLEEKATS